ncbi:MAG: hypothetical protein IPN85_13735 [Flavobacteriales bacterium]|nr:hypothetical protein [Flavobacteriales bacterium]MBL0035875.1 hypothetical protein [Flavobacteriales bacterium]
MRLIHSLVAVFVTVVPLSAQTTLFQTGFDAPPFAFDVNTSDVGSSASGANTWLINDVYAGGNGDVICSGFPLNFTIPSTPGQPAGITNANGNYLHIASSEAVLDGILCCSFAAADGFCTNPGNHFARMNSDVSTAGQTGTTLSFWWLCNGGNQNYGEVYYSTNSGISWNLISTPIAQYRNQSTWVQQSITLPAFDGQATLRFGFRFFNATSLLGGSDPGFGVDDVLVTVAGAGTNAIACQTAANQFCTGESLLVTYTAQGTYTAGNVFTAELSDAGGSFAAPTAIGTLLSTTSGVITCQVPPGATPGLGYQIRVVASTPVTIGTPAPVNIAINDAPDAGTGGALTICSNVAPFNLFNFLGGTPDPGGVWTDPLGAPFSGVFTPGVSPAGCYTYVVAGIGSCPAATSQLCVVVAIAPNAGISYTGTLCSNATSIPMLPFLGGATQPGGSWSAPGGAPHGPNFIPGVDPLGCYTYTVLGMAPCANATAVLCIIGVVPAPDAGSDSSVVVCDNGPTDLFPGLGADADTGGTWLTFGGTPFSGTYDPAANQPGPFIYQINNACGGDQAIVTVTAEVPGPDAGLDSSVVICQNAAPYDLFDGLGGSPDAGGTWVDANATGALTASMLDPASLSPGVYPLQYIVPGTAPCSDAIAEVTVTIDPCSGIQEAGPTISLLSADGQGLYVLAAPNEILEITVLNAVGQRVAGHAGSSQGERVTVDLRSSAPGTYVVVVRTLEGIGALRLVRTAQ